MEESNIVLNSKDEKCLNCGTTLTIGRLMNKEEDRGASLILCNSCGFLCIRIGNGELSALTDIQLAQLKVVIPARMKEIAAMKKIIKQRNQ